MESKGGMGKLKSYTKKELDRTLDTYHEFVMNALSEKFNTTKENATGALPASTKIKSKNKERFYSLVYINKPISLSDVPIKMLQYLS